MHYFLDIATLKSQFICDLELPGLANGRDSIPSSVFREWPDTVVIHPGVM